MKVTPEEFFNHQEKTRAHEIALKAKGEYDGYALRCSFEGENATMYFQTKNIFDSEKKLKNIGTLCFDKEHDVVTYCKYGFVESEHKFKKNDGFGVCWAILERLSVATDFLFIQEKTASGEIKKYNMSVRKAMTYATDENFLQFKR